MNKRELSVVLSADVSNFLARNGHVTVVKPSSAPRIITAFVRTSPGSNGNRVNGSRLGSKSGRLA